MIYSTMDVLMKFRCVLCTSASIIDISETSPRHPLARRQEQLNVQFMMEGRIDLGTEDAAHNPVIDRDMDNRGTNTRQMPRLEVMDY